MNEKPIAAVLGLGIVGASLALGLQRTKRFGQVVGWDPSFDVAREAQKAQVAERYVKSAAEAVRSAAVVFLAIGHDALHDALTATAPNVRAGAVVCSLLEAQEAAASEAAAILPANVSYVNGHPILWEPVSDDTAPSPDLFKEGVFCLAPSAAAHPDAIAFLGEIAEELGMKPYFLDAREHDAFYTGVGRLPAVLGAALLQCASEAPAWRELTRLAGGEFRQLVTLTQVEPGKQQAAMAVERDHLIRWIDSLTGALGSLRSALQDGQEPADFFPGAAERARRWQIERRVPWSVVDLPETPQPGKRRFPF